MIDALTNFLTGQGFAVMMLACGTLVVVVEAVRASRRALWGDMFTADFDQASGKMRREVGIKKEGTWLLYFLEKEARRWRGPAV